MSTGRYFFATAADVLPGLQRFEARNSVRYVLCGLFESRDPLVFLSADALPELGRAPAGEALLTPALLVLSRDAALHVREVQHRSGGPRFAVDQLANPDSAILRPGGAYSADVLISGEVSTTGVTPAATALCRRLARAITSGFERVQSFWLGPEASSMFRGGARLTQSIRAPRLYDLRAS